jgi:threonine dehydrogenase-like Zn-dependent dehydrogenase
MRTLKDEFVCWHCLASTDQSRHVICFGLFRREVSHPDDYHLIDYRTEDFEACARQATNGSGVELILDAVGRDSLKKGYRLLAPTGRLGVFGASSAATNKTGGKFGLVSMLASTPWLQFNPLSLMNANKGVFGGRKPRSRPIPAPH